MNAVPSAVLAEVRADLASEVGDSPVNSARPVGGGCISPCARIEIGGQAFFLKWGAEDRTPIDFFAAEARSLVALRDTGSVRVPVVRGVGRTWLLLEWLEPGRPSAEAWAALGRSLAVLHAPTAAPFGWPMPNYIGTLPQSNDQTESWAAFWRERRLAPQLERTYAGGFFASKERRRFERVLVHLESLLAEGVADGASLLHGDLWSGNVLFAADGDGALIDPSCYLGHREVDLAMAELFGGFPPEFFAAYTGMSPLRQGYAELRRPLYQLYYQLVHVDLFGQGYVAGAIGLLEAVESIG